MTLKIWTVTLRPEDLVGVNWSGIILAICGARNWRSADLARYLVKAHDCGDNVQALSAELGRIARLEIAEPRSGL